MINNTQFESDATDQSGLPPGPLVSVDNLTPKQITWLDAPVSGKRARRWASEGLLDAGGHRIRLRTCRGSKGMATCAVWLYQFLAELSPETDEAAVKPSRRATPAARERAVDRAEAELNAIGI